MTKEPIPKNNLQIMTERDNDKISSSGACSRTPPRPGAVSPICLSGAISFLSSCLYLCSHSPLSVLASSFLRLIFPDAGVPSVTRSLSQWFVRRISFLPSFLYSFVFCDLYPSLSFLPSFFLLRLCISGPLLHALLPSFLHQNLYLCLTQLFVFIAKLSLHLQVRRVTLPLFLLPSPASLCLVTFLPLCQCMFQDLDSITQVFAMACVSTYQVCISSISPSLYLPSSMSLRPSSPLSMHAF